MSFLVLGVGIWGDATDRPWQTMLITTLAVLQLGHAPAVRSERESLFTQGITTAKPLLWTVVVTLAIQVIIVYRTPMQTLLDTEALSALELGIVLVVSTGAFLAVEAEKLLRRRFSADAWVPAVSDRASSVGVEFDAATPTTGQIERTWKGLLAAGF